jgi:hypothetical protein
MKASKATDQICVGCGRRIPWWWFSAGDDQGWWHWHCIIIDTWKQRHASQ